MVRMNAKQIGAAVGKLVKSYRNKRLTKAQMERQRDCLWQHARKQGILDDATYHYLIAVGLRDVAVILRKAIANPDCWVDNSRFHQS